MEIGSRIAALRKANSWTQEQLADQIGTTRQAISKWESDKSEPDLRSLVKMGELFAVSMDYLILGCEPESAVVTSEASVDSSGEFENIRSSHDLLFYRRWRLMFASLTAAGLWMETQIPGLAERYQLYALDTYQTCYADIRDYYVRWPILGVIILGGLACLGGWRGIIWSNQRIRVIGHDKEVCNEEAVSN